MTDLHDLDERAAQLIASPATGASERRLADLAIRCLDLTSLDPGDTAASIEALCERALRPSPADPEVLSVAAVCVQPRFIDVVLSRLRGTAVKVAVVAGDFPAATAPRADRLREIHDAVAAGVDEVDVVLPRAPLLQGRLDATFAELVAMREAAGEACLKVILETGALGSAEHVREASLLAAAAGADFVKTSTGKVPIGATPGAALCVMEAARDFHAATDVAVGVKVAGGVRTADDAIGYLRELAATLGESWLTPGRFRIGASSLLDDLVRRR